MSKSKSRKAWRCRWWRPGIEALEGRALLSFIGSGQVVSHVSFATDNFESDNASSANGTSVAEFASQYASTGTLTRSFIFINFDSNPEHNPTIAMDNAGNARVNSSTNRQDIFNRRFFLT